MKRTLIAATTLALAGTLFDEHIANPDREHGRGWATGRLGIKVHTGRACRG